MRLPYFTHRFTLTGLNLERFLNLMHAKEIPLLSVCRADHRTLMCECYSADLKVISQLAEEKGWRIQSKTPLSLSARLVHMRKRPGLPIGAVLMLISMMVLSQFVWRVDIRNAGPYHADMAAYLAQEGYQPGVRSVRVDAAALESALLRRYPKIAWFQVYVSNATLVVEAYHGVPMPETEGTAPGDVLASRDGIIHSIRVYAGTAAVKAGDTVRKGDVLIRGEERSSDGAVVQVHAQGAVIARCWQSQTVRMPLVEINSTETGREHTVLSLHTPWFDWPLQQDMPDYLSSNLYIADTPVGGVYFPIFIRTSTYREVSMEYAPRDAAQVRQEAENAAFEKLKTALFDDEIIDKWVDYCMIEDDILAVTVTVEQLVDIGEFSSP